VNNKQKGILYSILASLMFGINPVFAKLVIDLTNVETMNVLWTIISSILFVFLFVFSKKTEYFKIIIKNWKKVALIGLIVTIGSLLYTYGILYSGPTNAAFLIQFTTVFTILFGIIFLKERFTKLEGLGILIAVFGVFFLAYGNIEIEILSTLILLIASLFFALENLLEKVYVKNINPLTLAGGRSIFIFLFIFAYSILSGRLETNISSVVFFYAILGSITGVFLSFVLFFKALKVFEISKSMTIRTTEPFLTAIFSFIILSLIPTVNQLFGGMLIVIGIAILSLTKGK